MCQNTPNRDTDNTVPVSSAAAVLIPLGAMVRTHAAIRNGTLEPGGYITFDAGRDLSFQARMNHNANYDLWAIRAHGAPVAHMCDLSKDALGLAILTIVDRA